MTLPLLFAAFIGFKHAFDADHVLAVSNIVNSRKNISQAVRDGLFWGLGHTSVIFAVGCLIIMGKAFYSDKPFEFFEVLVGVSLILLGAYRLYRFKGYKKGAVVVHPDKQNHKLAYSIGMIHGLAGSGAVILVAMSELNSTFESILYLVIFGIGSILGMTVIAGVFNLPFSKKIKTTDRFQSALLLISALLCLFYGLWMVLRYFL